MDKRRLLLQLPSLIKKRQTQQAEMLRQQHDTRVTTLYSMADNERVSRNEPASGGLPDGKSGLSKIKENDQSPSTTKSRKRGGRYVRKLYLPMPDYQLFENT